MRLIAFWNKGTSMCNIPFDHMAIEESVIFLYRGSDMVGQFDMGFVELWYITEQGVK